jgi:hypothetical protein
MNIKFLILFLVLTSCSSKDDENLQVKNDKIFNFTMSQNSDGDSSLGICECRPSVKGDGCRIMDESEKSHPLNHIDAATCQEKCKVWREEHQDPDLCDGNDIVIPAVIAP